MLASRIVRASRFFNNIKNYCTSALYVTGDKGQDNCAVLTPHIDIEDRFADKAALEANIEARKINMNLFAIETRWLFYLHLLDRKQILGHTKFKLGKEINYLFKDEDTNRDEIAKLKYQLRVVKDEYSVLKNYMYGVEESAAMYALSIPNVLHPKTPIQEDTVVYVHGECPTHTSKSHIDIGIDKQYLEFTDNYLVYLMNDAALFEYAITNFLQSKLLDLNFSQFSNADFVKSVIVEGCATDFQNKTQIITLHDDINHSINQLHLTGGASHYSFMAYFARYSITNNQFPMKYFAAGRLYEPVTKSEPSLFNLLQQSAFEIFIATSDNDTDIEMEFENLVQHVKDIYDALDLHYRLILSPACKIDKYESLRLSIQMFSSFQQQYVEVGNVSVCDDYLSKRLLFTYNEKKERKFPKMIVGNLLNVQKLLACKLENQIDKELLCDVLKEFSPM